MTNKEYSKFNDQLNIGGQNPPEIPPKDDDEKKKK